MGYQDTRDIADIAGMDMPCECDCGNWFDLNEGHSCGERSCHKVLCIECLPEPFDFCPNCK